MGTGIAPTVFGRCDAGPAASRNPLDQVLDGSTSSVALHSIDAVLRTRLGCVALTTDSDDLPVGGLHPPSVLLVGSALIQLECRHDDDLPFCREWEESGEPHSTTRV